MAFLEYFSIGFGHFLIQSWAMWPSSLLWARLHYHFYVSRQRKSFLNWQHATCFFLRFNNFTTFGKDFFLDQGCFRASWRFPRHFGEKEWSLFFKIVLVEEEISLPCLKMQQKSGGKKCGNYLQLSRYDKLYASRQKLLMQLFFRHHFCETNFGY